MRLPSLIGKEMWERPGPMITAGLAILLGVTALVAVHTMTVHSEKAVARELDSLGANVLILPKGVTLQDYYSADLHGETMPEELVTRLTLSNLEGVDNLSPKLCVPAALAGRNVTLTGILPRSEFQAKAAWQGAGIFARPIGCGSVDVPTNTPADPHTLVRKRVIETLGYDEVLVGSDVASRCGLAEGDTLRLLGEKFTVLAVLPATGTVDDGRVFAHLHTVQDLSGKGEVLNVIEVVGCCKQIAAGLVEKLSETLPETRVVTIAQVIKTQQNVNDLMGKLTFLFLGFLLVIGGAGTATAMYANVRERRREIGTLMALGATPGLVLRLFVGKAVVLGLAGGVGGYLLGSGLAGWFGPQWVGVPVRPIPILALVSAVLALAVALLATCLPARSAARLDPCLCLREV
jgi:putative ABC transport system permease protein